MPQRFLPVLLAVLTLWLLPERAVAQDDALRFFQSNPSSNRLFFRQEAPRRQAPAVRARPRYEEPVVRRRVVPRPESEVAVTAPDTTPKIPPSIFVHVIGDSLSESLAGGLKEHLADRPEIGVVKRGRPSSGLVRDDHHDWPKAVRELLGGTEKVDLIVVLLGSNERQQLRDETGGHDFKSERWRELYIRRVDDLIAAAREKRIPMLWVGMPVLESPRLSADMLYLNEIFKERASRAGIAYVDVWEAFVNDQNQYAAMGPDVNGEIVRLRTLDGIHFTRAGSRKLGFFTGRDISNSLNQLPGTAVAVALPQDLSEQIRRDTPGLSPEGLQSALALPEDLPTLPVIRERPLQGPVIELTAAPMTPGAQLLRQRIVAPANEMTILVEQALTYGRLTPPKPGRADDHRWPGDRGLN